MQNPFTSARFVAHSVVVVLCLMLLTPAWTSAAAQESSATSATHQAPLRTVVVLDKGVEDWQTLAAGVGPDAMIIEVDPEEDGLATIAAGLSGHVGIQSIQIFAHGEPGALQLGATRIDRETLAARAEPMDTIRTSLAPEGDILVGGCRVAQGDRGRDWVSTLSQLTGADVAASTNATGARASGADWRLEARDGRVDTPLAISQAARTAFSGQLAITQPATFGFSTYDGSLPNGNDFNQTIEADNTTDLMAFANFRIDAFDDPDFGVNLKTATASVFSDPGGDSFRFISFTTEAFCGTPMSFDVVGYEAGTPVDSLSFTISGTGGPITRSVDFPAVDEVRFENYITGNDAQCLVIDDIALDQAVSTNTPPAFSNLDATVFYDEAAGTPVVIDEDASISDAELDATDDYAGSTLILEREGGAVADDSFGFDTSAGTFTVSGGDLLAGGSIFASFTESGGTLTVTFDSSGTTATSALVDDVLQSLTYANVGAPSVVEYGLSVTFDDGGLQSGQSLAVSYDPELVRVEAETTYDFTELGPELPNLAPVDARIIEESGHELLFYGFRFGDANESGLIDSNELQFDQITPDAATTGVRFVADAPFALKSIDLDNFSSSPQDITIHGFLSGAPVANRSDSHAAESGYVTRPFDSVDAGFARVDEIRLTTSDNASAAIDNLVVAGVGSTVVNVSSTATDGLYGIGNSIPITVTFDTNVNVSGTPQLVLETGSTDRLAAYVGGSGTDTLTFAYTVQPGDNSADLAYVSSTALLPNGGSITNSSGNDAALALPAPGTTGSLSANRTIVVDGITPSVSNVSSPSSDGIYKIGDAIDITVAFDETVNVTGVPRLTLETGATDRAIDYAGGSGTDTLTFTYMVQPGDETADLDYLSDTALAPNGGIISDAAGNQADLTLPSPGAPGSLGANKAISVDGVPPSVLGVSSPAGDGIYKVGDLIPVTVQFDQAVVVTGTPQLTLETGTTHRVVNYSGGSGTSILTFDYLVQAGDTATDLDYASTAALAANGGTVRDAAGNDASLTLPAPGDAGSLSANQDLVVDTTPPIITNVSIPNAAMIVGDTVTATITVDDDGGDTYTNVNGSIGGISLTGPTRVNSTTYTAEFTVIEGGADIPAGDDIPVNLTLDDSVGNTSTPYTAAISQGSDAIDANSPAVSGAFSPSVAVITDAHVRTDGFTLSIDFNETMDAATTPTVSFPTGGEDPTAVGNSVATLANASGAWSNGDSTYTVTYDVADDDIVIEDIDVRVEGARDAAGNPITATTQTDIFGVVTAPAPAIQSIGSSSADGTYGVGDTVNVTVTFDEAVDFTAIGGSLQAILNSGATVTLASSDTAGQTAFSGTYSVTEGETDSADLNVTGVELSGAATLLATDDGVPADLASLPAGQNLADQADIVIDANTPTVTAPDLAAASDSGVSDSDDLTNVTAPTITGSGTEAGAAVTVRVGGSTVGSTTAAGSGAWSFTLADGDLAEGGNSIDIVADDGVNTSGDSADLVLILDTTPPTALDDTATAGEDDGDTPLPGRLTDNDNDAAGTDPVTAVAGSAANPGTAVDGDNGGRFTVNADGSASFDPDGAFEDLAAGDTRDSGVDVTIRDVAGNTATARLTVTVEGANDAPAIEQLDGDTLVYATGTGAQPVDADPPAIIDDPDSVDFDAGTLTMSITANAQSGEDVLSIENQGMGPDEVGTSGSDISFEGTTVGTATGGDSGNPLEISFNGAADAAAVAAVVGAVTYDNTASGPVTDPRTVEFGLTDGDGGTATPVTTTVTFRTVGVTVTPTSGLATAEDSGSDTFTVVLDSAPIADVTVPVNSDDPGEGTVSPSTLVFSPTNWDVPQTVTVTGVDDTLDDGDQAYRVIVGDPASADAAYDALTDADTADVAVTNTDDDADEDGVGSGIEDGVPNPDGSGTGDGNGDGEPDRLQSHVTSIETGGGDYATLANGDATNGHVQTDVVSEPAPADAPAGLAFPYGLLHFTVHDVGSGGSVEMTVYVPHDPTIVDYYKQARDTGEWESVNAVVTHIPAGNPTKTRLTFTLTDGDRFDTDGVANGDIVDPGGPIRITANGLQAIPALGLPAVGLLAALLVALGLTATRRERQQGASANRDEEP